MCCQTVKPQMARFFCQPSKMRLANSNQALTQHLNRLLAGTGVARMELAKRMDVADGTLGRIKYGKGNPTIDVLDKIARYFRMQPWELLIPPEELEQSGRQLRETAARYAEAPPTAAKLHRWIDELDDEKRRGLIQFLGIQ